jgi:hypothetical protein
MICVVGPCQPGSDWRCSKLRSSFDVHRFLFLLLETYRSFNGKDVSPFCKAICPALGARSPSVTNTAPSAGAAVSDGGLSAAIMGLATPGSAGGHSAAPYAAAAAAPQPPSAAPHDDRLSALVNRLALGPGAPSAPFALSAASVAAGLTPGGAGASPGAYPAAGPASAAGTYGMSAAATGEADVEPFAVLQVRGGYYWVW